MDSHKAMRFRANKLLLLPIILSFVLASCGDDGKQGAGKRSGKFGGGGKPPVKIIPVEVVKPQLGLAASFYVTTATLEPSSDAKINARTAGAVRQILHEEGDDVLVGETLLILDDDDQRLRLKQARQKLESATREFTRLSKMKKSGAVSTVDWDAAENTYRTSVTDKELAELALSYTRVAAPFDGRVVWREVDLGANVGQGELLFRMMSINPLLVRVHIPANRLGRVAIGEIVELKIDSLAYLLKAKVDLVSPIVDPTTGTIKITLKLKDYPKVVRPGDFAEIHMMTDQHENSMLVPSNAIIEERGKHFVYTVSDGKAHRRTVKPGFVMREKTEIVEGIDIQDSVVIKGQRNLNDDIAVEVLTANDEIVAGHKNSVEKKSNSVKDKLNKKKKGRNKRGAK